MPSIVRSVFKNLGSILLKCWLLIGLTSIAAVGFTQLAQPPESLSARRVVYDLLMLSLIFITSFWNAVVVPWNLSIGNQFGKLLASIIGGIGVFAAAFKDIGVAVPEGISHDPWDALFLSLASWTTFSTPDLAPTDQGTYIAIAESWFGYVFLALFLTALMAQLQRISNVRGRDSA